MKANIKYDFLNRPGLYWSDEELTSKVNEFKQTAATCLDEVPSYQCLEGNRDFFRRALIVTATDKRDGKLIGFCSAVLFEMDNKDDVLHLGLTCVDPKYRGLKLTHYLTSKVLKGYFTEISMFGSLWISNVACVLSSLGNVAKYFEHVYPSPYLVKPSKKHVEIAKTISSKYREDFFVEKNITFDEELFLFKGSVSGNSFEKSADDARFFHRDPTFNNFYKSLLDFKRGDEVLQIGRISIFTFLKYFVRKFIKKQIKITNLVEVKNNGISIK